MNNRIIDAILNCLIVCLTVITILIILLILNRAKPFGYNISYGSGTSMQPLIMQCGFFVENSNITKETLSIGDFVMVDINGYTSYYNTEGFNGTNLKIMHKTIEKNPKCFITRGINNEQNDQCFDYNRLISKIDFYADAPKFACDFIKNYE